MKIGLALSGGGFRATAYHLGVLARLAAENHLEEVTILSTVSGGSLCVGLIYALNGFCWPTSEDYLNKVLPEARARLTSLNFQTDLIRQSVRAPWRFFRPKARTLSRLMQKHWGVTAYLADIPDHPRWLINATCYETGKNWRFESHRMGDYSFGYTADTSIPLSDAMAASAGFPGLIGPLVLPTRSRSWFKYRDILEQPHGPKTEMIKPPYSQVHLWDGGVYDNHGLESLHDFSTGWPKDVDFLVVSDGSGKPHAEPYRVGARVFLRIITGVMMDQIRSLRARAILERIKNHDNKGVYLSIGMSCQQVIENAVHNANLIGLCVDTLGPADVERAGNFPTVIRRLTQDEFELLFRHGFEVTNCTLFAYYPDMFQRVSYSPQLTIPEPASM